LNSNLKTSLCAIVGTAVVLCGTLVSYAAPPSDAASAPSENQLTVAAAREQAKLMHTIYTAALDAMHHHYFHNHQAVVPARALEDVFAEIAKQSSIRAKWISVNTAAMSIHHEPQDEFEKQAATEIAAGKDEFELVEKGYYRRASAIPLTGTCVGCHTGFFAGTPKSPRFAGLVIGVPLKSE
jgi:hypothetical protein